VVRLLEFRILAVKGLTDPKHKEGLYTV